MAELHSVPRMRHGLCEPCVVDSVESSARQDAFGRLYEWQMIVALSIHSSRMKGIYSKS